ncbi:unannotated protein [freshwater metagenome]|jgi:MerR family transcriptional regulator/heat shock protein HspR|uniref:Unannotated protein n=1 Tax=freshwater metagenome TaxID=449393 RepID=A0A6J7EEP5_9ZZZZ|nr:MerR family transcriptional regulator [Actinomycetota bacterium]
MMEIHFEEHNDSTPVYVISIAAQLSGLHPQTLRQYDRMGLVSPQRTPGGRRYSLIDVRRLQRVQNLAQTGLNLEGIRRVMALEEEVEHLRIMVQVLQSELDGQMARRRELMPLADGGALVVWRSDPQ